MMIMRLMDALRSVSVFVFSLLLASLSLSLSLSLSRACVSISLLLKACMCVCRCSTSCCPVATDYHDTMQQHNAISELHLIPLEQQRTYCVGTPGEAGLPHDDHWARFANSTYNLK